MSRPLQKMFTWCFLAYLAILPVAGTIALRNLLLALLLPLLLWGWREGGKRLHGKEILRWMPYPLLLWAVFLLLFPFWAVNQDIAWANLRGQWGESLAVWCVGLGAALILGSRGPGLLSLGLASAFLVGLHLLLTLLAWAGLFGADVPESLPISQMWQAALDTLSAQGRAAWHWQGFPWMFRGFDPMHGNLGYTASQAIALFLVCLVSAFAVRKPRNAWMVALLTAACFLSIVVANSRGAVLFSILLVPLAAGAYVATTARAGVRLFRGLLPELGSALILLVIALALLLGQSIRTDARWHTMLGKAYAGFLVQSPIDFLCNGLSPGEHVALAQHIAPQKPADAEPIIQGLNGDGGRVVLMRAGMQLVWEHPLGMDGSRQSYEKIIAQKCGHQPVFAFAHAHQAWINLALAFGWGGALLFAGLLGYFAMAGARGLRLERSRDWAFALFLLSVFWILRGLTDAVYQEHYLLMQALLLGYLWGRMKVDSISHPHGSDAGAA